MENELISFELLLEPLIGAHLYNNSLIAAVTAAIITASVALIAALLSFYSSRKQLLDSLDSKSDWRKEIYNIASKPEIVSEDIYRLRSSLRLAIKNTEFRQDYKKLNDHLILIKKADNFNNVSDILILYCEKLIEYDKSPYNITGTVGERNSHYIRTYCMYLLKHQWETLSANKFDKWHWRIFEEKDIIKNLIEELER